jgi:alpha-D-ribose 1-methylphosphonate 5-triphosphate synthase subunit PhnH
MRPGLADPVRDSQAVFRALLDAMAHPGRIVDVPGPCPVPARIDPAAAAVALSLVDFETPLWLDTDDAELLAYLRFHCGCPIVAEPGEARFAIVTGAGAMPRLAAFDAGSDLFPDHSATLILQVPALAAGRGRRLAGPGIAGEARLDVTGLPASFWPDWADNHASFPRGVDVVLSAGTVIAALPRTTRVEG